MTFTQNLSIEIPKRVSRLPRDARGLPIPFVTFVDPVTGKPDFRVLDVQRQALCIKNKQCAICGQQLGKFIAFIGGPKSGESRAFVDPGMHRQCAEFAAKVCPFISRETAEYRDISEKEEQTLVELGILVSTSPTIPAERDDPSMFIYITKGYRPVRLSNAEVGSVAEPWVEVIQVEQKRPAWRA